MEIKIPKQAEQIIRKLEEKGHEAYVVGGCVRDALLLRVPEDWDITTSATPFEVKEIFRRTIDTGIVHGTVTVMMEQNGYEVTTYRIDGEYEDNRHPKEVAYTKKLEEDLARRDFTINAMAYHPDKGLVDCFSGMSDMEGRMIRCVGNAEERFCEDALRILRALRFSAQLNFMIERDTEKAIVALAANLKTISAERIRVELCKLLLSEHPEKMLDAYEFGITGVVFPEFDWVVEGQNGHFAACALRSIQMLNGWVKEGLTVAVDKKMHQVLMLALLFHRFGMYRIVTAKTVLRRLKFDNETVQKVTTLLSYPDTVIPPEKKCIRHTANRIGPDLMPYLFLTERAVIEADPNEYAQALEVLEKDILLYKEILHDGDCLTLKDLEIKGNDLLQIGFQPGKRLGETLQRLLNEVLDTPAKNTYDELLAIAQKSM